MKTLSDLLNYLIVLSILALAGSFFYFNDYKKKQSAPTGMSLVERDKMVDQVVNKYIKETTMETSLNKIKIDEALAAARKKIADDREAKRLKDEKEMQNIPIEKQVATEADLQAQAAAMQSQAPAPQPARQETIELNPKKMTQAQKEAYAREYIENARKGGYQIELSEDLEVIKATPIRKPSQQSDTVEGAPQM
ncbi:MAG: hypothetical protein ACXWQQ_13115 [Pseudobdellovibrio sp.]